MYTLDFLKEAKTPGTGYDANATRDFYEYMNSLRRQYIIQRLQKDNPEMTLGEIDDLIDRMLAGEES